MPKQRTETATSAGYGFFPFFSLPTEIQLRILEFTDLIAPSPFKWDPVGKFYIASYKNPQWRRPLPLFLVSRAFSLIAMEVFWKHNYFKVLPDTKPLYEPVKPGQPPSMPRHFSGSEFLGGYVPESYLRHIRNLDLQLFGITHSDYLEDATKDWFGVLEYIRDRGGLRLDFLSISATGETIPTLKVWKAIPKEAAIQLARSSVDKRIWPLPYEDGPPPFVRQLSVDLSSDGVKALYIVRRIGQRAPIRQEEMAMGEKLKSEQPYARRVISWPPTVLAVGSLWGSSIESGEWIEEVWMETYKRREY